MNQQISENDFAVKKLSLNYFFIWINIFHIYYWSKFQEEWSRESQIQNWDDVSLNYRINLLRREIPGTDHVRYFIGERQVQSFHCERCPAKFSQRLELNRHLAVTHDRQCPDCFLRFANKAARDRHRPFCARRTIPRIVRQTEGRSNMVRAQPVRRRARNHRCTFCERKFETEESRNRHQRRCSHRYASTKWILKE